MSRLYVVYALKEPSHGEIRYVGLTGKPLDKRLREHLKRRGHENWGKYHWLKSLTFQGLLPIIVPVVEGLNLEQAKLEEISLIARLREIGCNLFNLSKGGDAFMAGRKHSPETIKRMRKVHAGEKNGFYGKRHTPESLARLSLALKGRLVWNKDKPHSLSHRLALSKARMGKEPWNKGKSKVDIHQVRCLKILGLNQTQIAELIGTTQSVISRLATGKRSSYRRPYVAERISGGKY